MAAKNIEEIVKEIKDLWEKKEIIDCPFWGSLTSSYYDSDYSQISNNRFYSEIEFYPNLITLLSENLSETATVEITFFSTLLPRNYWNFPLFRKLLTNKELKSEKDEFDEFFISRTAKFLDLYREALSKSIVKLNSKNKNKIKVKRILIISDEDKDYVFNTRLFTVKQLLDDQKHYVNNRVVRWENICNDNDICNKYNLGIDFSIFEKIYNIPISKKDYPTQTKELRNDFKDKSFYAFSNKKEKFKHSVYDYYVEVLHSENQAYIAVNSKNQAGEKIRISGNTITKRNFDDLKLSNNFKPDLAHINIKDNDKKDKNIILNTYMDITNDIVKLQVIDQDNSKDKIIFDSLIEDINKFNDSVIYSLNKNNDKNNNDKKLNLALSILNKYKANQIFINYDFDKIMDYLKDKKELTLIDIICNKINGPAIINKKYEEIKK